jgi:N-succinyldiaminopimelate aminotransferase
VPELREAVADHQRRFWGLTFDPDREVLVTAGATEAIAAAMLALCESGDEVIAFEPFYDAYAATVAMAGARLRPVRLHPPGYDFDPAELRAAVGPRTRLVLLNSPHNPTGKVFSREELATVAELCCARNLLAVTDEVYEHMVYEGEHVPLASLPGMRDRTLTVSSGGKTFAFTGWKVGWACGPAPLVAAVRTAKQFLTYVNAAPLQPAIAVGLRLPDAYFTGLREAMRERRNRLCAGLEAAGFGVFRPAGTYFVTADIRPLGADDGVAFCRALPERCGVVAIPNAVFYADPEAGRHLVRFAFCKRPDLLDEAVARLRALAA